MPVRKAGQREVGEARKALTEAEAEYTKKPNAVNASAVVRARRRLDDLLKRIADLEAREIEKCTARTPRRTRHITTI
jgi:hypothetical protein